MYLGILCKSSSVMEVIKVRNYYKVLFKKRLNESIDGRQFKDDALTSCKNDKIHIYLFHHLQYRPHQS